MKNYLIATLVTINTLCAQIPNGRKSIDMFKHLDEKVLLAYDEKTKVFVHCGKNFEILNSSQTNFISQKIVSISSSPLAREIISLDPEESPFLNQAFQELVSYLKTQLVSDSSTADRVCNTIIEFIACHIFSPSLSTEEAVDHFTASWIATHLNQPENFTFDENLNAVPVIPIDDFIQKRTGVCRHYSLVTAYLINRLSKETSLLPKGICYHVRDMIEIENGYAGHAWNVYIADEIPLALHIDSLWKLIKSFQSPTHLLDLYAAYGQSAIESEIKRFSISSEKANNE